MSETYPGQMLPELQEKTTVDSNDLFYMVSSNASKKIKGSNLREQMKPSDYTGATSSTNGANGLVPQPTTSDVDRFLKGDGTWGDISYAVGEASDSIASFSDGSNLPMRSLKAYIEPVQSGSGEPSPSNVRPISGWTACNVVRTGKNLFDKTAITDNVYLSTTTGLTESNSDYCVSDYIKVKANETIYMRNSNSARRWFYDSNKTPKTYLNGATTYTPTEDGYIRVTLNKLGTSAIDLNTYQIEFGSSPSTYEPFGNTYTIQFTDGSNPLTVYGGYVDVVSGVLTVDRIKTSMPANWTVNTESSTYWLITNTRSDAISVENTDTSIRVISNGFKGISANEMLTKMTTEDNVNSIALISTKRLFLKVAKADYPTLQDLYSMIQTKNLQVDYELATPQIYQLTPTQVKSLLSVNNVWADTGDVDVHYVRDLTITIDDILSRLEALEG